MKVCVQYKSTCNFSHWKYGLGRVFVSTVKLSCIAHGAGLEFCFYCGLLVCPWKPQVTAGEVGYLALRGNMGWIPSFAPCHARESEPADKSTPLSFLSNTFCGSLPKIWFGWSCCKTLIEKRFLNNCIHTMFRTLFIWRYLYINICMEKIEEKTCFDLFL